jgi:tetraacyldisaccharide 4'-kinase
VQGQPLPFGKLREPVEMLQFADAIVYDGGRHSNLAAAGTRSAPTFTMRRSIALATAEPVFAVAGIAGPERFFDALTRAGYTVVGTRGFADHHRYSRTDVAAMQQEATRAGASAIVTTSKDMVRLEPVDRASPLPFLEIPLDVAVEPADTFRDWLLGRVAEARR